MTYEENVYYNPETFGLTTIGCWDLREPDWSFDLLLVLKETSTGKLFAATDSGCSCPSPFEDHVFPQDFTEVRGWQDVKALVDNHYGADDSFKEADLRAAIRRELGS